MPTLRLVVLYRTPSLNQTKRQHWAAQFKEKRKAMTALLSALQATASDPSTPIISPGASRTFSTAADTLACYLATNRGASGSKPSKSASGRTRKKRP